MQEVIATVQQLFACPIYSVSDLIEHSSNNAVAFETGVSGLDRLFSGGVHSGQLIEIGTSTLRIY
jgi:hypothetical protein